MIQYMLKYKPRVASILFLLLVSMWMLGVACNQNSAPSHGHDDGDDPPAPPSYDYEEQEPNDDLWNAQWITVLPVWDSETIQGNHWLPVDLDCYWFFLDPPLGVKSVSFNLMLETDSSLLPKIKLWQTIFDGGGVAIGHQLKGTWVGEDGYLAILNFEVEYDFFTNNDLLIEVIPWGGLRDTPLADDTYLIDFWCN